MPSLLGNTVRYRMPNLRLLATSVMLLFIGAGSAPEAGAQSSTTLKLIDQVSEPGGATVPGDTLSSGARAAVLSRETEVVQAYALSNLEFDRDGIKKRIREGSAKTFRLIRGGRTPRQFERTEAPGKVYYVLALTAGGELLESYVNAGNRSYLPGFAIVASGNMPMGQVPEEHREPLRGALTSAMSPEVADTADGSQAEEDSAAKTKSAEEKQSELRGEVSDRSGGYLQVLWAALSSWFGALVLGLLVGGIGAWGVYRTYSEKLSRKRRKISGLERRLYNEGSRDNSKKSRKNSVHEKVFNEKKEQVKELKKRLDKKKSKIAELRNEIKRLKGSGTGRDTGRQPQWAEGLPDRKQRSDTGTSSNRSVQQDSSDRTADLIGRAFVNWCNDAGAAMVDRHSMFANKLQDSLPGAELQRIFREKNAAGVVFADDVQDAVEYWHVRVDGRDFLLPQPHRSGFREVEECFQATCTSPNQVQDFQPAELQSSGGEYELKNEGILA